MAKSALLAVAVLLAISGRAQTNGAPRTVVSREDATIPAHTLIVVRTGERIIARTDGDATYSGTVDKDVADSQGRVTIPKGSNARLFIQKTGVKGNLVLDLESVTINGGTYSLIASDSTSDKNVGVTHGAEINVPADAVLNFRLDNPLLLIMPVK